MNLTPLHLTAAIVSAFALAHCGSSSSGSTAVDASTDVGVGSDGSSQDDSAAAQDGSSPDDGSTVPDVSVADSGGDSGGGSDSGTATGTGDANQTPCDPNDPSTCATGDKCCSEPTHMNPPSVYECVPPEANGACPMNP
jgi:hypothetical protein